MDDLAGRHVRFDGVEEADELLVPVALHAAAEHAPVEHVEGGEQGGGAVALVVVGHGAARLFFMGRPGWVRSSAWICDFSSTTAHGMGRRVDIEADDVLELGHELGIVRELEAADAVRRQAVRLPDALHRGHADAGRLGHGGSVQWVASCGGSVAVRATTRSMTSWPSGATREGRVLSRSSPSTPSSAKRSCQRQTQVLDLPVRRMISTVPRRPPKAVRSRPARHASERRCGCRRSPPGGGDRRR